MSQNRPSAAALNLRRLWPATHPPGGFPGRALSKLGFCHRLLGQFQDRWSHFERLRGRRLLMVPPQRRRSVAGDPRVPPQRRKPVAGDPGVASTCMGALRDIAILELPSAIGYRRSEFFAPLLRRMVFPGKAAGGAGGSDYEHPISGKFLALLHGHESLRQEDGGHF